MGEGIVVCKKEIPMKEVIMQIGHSNSAKSGPKIYRAHILRLDHAMHEVLQRHKVLWPYPWRVELFIVGSRDGQNTWKYVLK